MPEPESDKWRRSPNLEMGLHKPNPYPTRAYPFTTEDESYQFRKPNMAYMDGSIPHDLPDGLQSDGTQPRHFGEQPLRNEDNETEIRHNEKRGY